MLTLLFAAFMQAAAAQTPAPPPPPAPAAGSPGTFKAGADLDAAIRKARAATPDMATAPVSITDQYRINVVHRGKAAGAIAHPGNTELHYILDGAGTIVTGGTIVRPAGGAAGSATIENGETRHMVKGDVIIVPPNTPHWYKDVEGTITYLEVRFVAPK
jgi:mannose-6-phosphate isomerase-like protein (cupin superfamily)